MKYIIKELNGTAEITDPIISVITDKIIIDNITCTLTVEVKLEIPNSGNFVFPLDKVSFVGLSMNIDETILLNNIITRLDDFKI